MAGPGSGGNVLAALCSFFIPGLGQLLQGRLGMAIVHFVLAGLLWFFFPHSIEFSGDGPSSLPMVLKFLGVAPMLCHA
jgi:TM2 domain-containing membrane protein YozV